MRHHWDTEETVIEELFTRSPVEIFLLDSTGDLLDVNPKACANLGLDQFELRGKTLKESGSSPGTHPLEQHTEAWDDREFITVEGTLTSADGSTYPIHARMVPLDDEDEPRYLAFSRDVSELQAREAELERNNERLEEFASLLSHDLRNPLNVAQGRLGLAETESDSEHLAAVYRSLDRMETLIESILTLTQDGQVFGEPTVVELVDVVEECGDLTADAPVRVDASLTGSVHANRSRLIEALEHLLRNAIDHGGSDVTIENDRLIDGFYVHDDGSGFSTDLPSALLEARMTTTEDGTGLGIYTVQMIVDAHGWSLHARNPADGGARVEIRDMDILED